MSDSEKSAAMLLADIQVRRGAGVLASVRRIGPELSQKMHKLFTSTNPEELLVNE
jgi:crossover junction endonuclease EME1